MHTPSQNQSVEARGYGGMQRRWLLIAIYCGCFSPLISHAQTQKLGILEEIVVTAQKREERLIDVPMSISAISGDSLTDAGIKNASDLSRVVPSLTVAENSPGRQMIVVRGVSSPRGTSSVTGVYLDEMPLSGRQDGFVPSYTDVRTIDLQRVEVLKGPQGTLFGEGAAGGVIRFITKDPDLSRVGGEISTDISNTTDGSWSEAVTGILNLPLATDVFGVRVAAFYEDQSGWIDQPSIGREDINDNEVKHVRVKAVYAPLQALKVTVMAQIHRNRGGASNIVNQQPLEQGNFIQPVDRNAPTGFTDDSDLFNLAVTYDLGFAELLSSTSHAKVDGVQSFPELLDEDPVPYTEVLLPTYQRHMVNTSQEFRLTSAKKGPFNWTIGANYKESELEGGFGSRGINFILFGGTLSASGLVAGSRPVGNSESWAGFLDASYLFFDRLQFGGGLRYVSETAESFDRAVSPRTVDSGDYSKVTYRGYAKYVLSQNANVYLNVGTGFRAGGFNGPAVVALGAPATILPETTLSYELGTKASLLEGRLSFGAAAFYTEYQDMMADRVVISPVNGLPVQYTGNGQSAEVKGFEWEIGWAATGRLTWTLAGDVTDSEITEVDPADPAPSYILGDRLSFVPEYSVSTSLSYELQWSETSPGFVRLSYDRKGKLHDIQRGAGSVVRDVDVVAPEVSFLNASVGGEIDNWNWALFGRNLLNEDKILYPTVFGFSAQARPRTFGVTVGRSF